MGSEIRIQELTFGFRNVALFQDFSFQTSASRVLIRGPSGCGKTTLLKIISGLLPVRTRDKILRPHPDFTVLQDDGLVPWLTGQENIELFAKSLWVRVTESDLFPLIEPFVHHRAIEMSFGQRRSVELVRALVSQRPLLLLDEPLNYLDRVRRERFLAFMGNADLCSSQIVMTSHYEDGRALTGAEVYEFEGDPPYSQLSSVP
ncbi:MAG: transporter [Caulobacter sp.]|nr:transporter [Caulobacter sp.]